MLRHASTHAAGVVISKNPIDEYVPLYLSLIHILIIGNGSNLLVKDGGIRGIVIEFGDNFNNFEIDGNIIKAQAGALLAVLGKAALREELTGFECISAVSYTHLIIVGKKEYIEKMKKNQLTRALRVDKMKIAALEATLRMYLDEKEAIRNIPTLKMITCSLKELDEKAGILLNKIQGLNIDADIQKEKNVSQVGGGSMPLEKLDTYTVTIKPNKFSVSYLEKRLRKSDAHIIGRINEDKYILDVRTIEENEFDLIVKELKIIFN